MAKKDWTKIENRYQWNNLQLTVEDKTIELDNKETVLATFATLDDGNDILTTFRLCGEVDIGYCMEYAEQQLHTKKKPKKENLATQKFWEQSKLDQKRMLEKQATDYMLNLPTI